MSLIVLEIPDDCPTCDKCGVPIESGFLALLCPFEDLCALAPEGGIDPEFRARFTNAKGVEHGG